MKRNTPDVKEGADQIKDQLDARFKKLFHDAKGDPDKLVKEGFVFLSKDTLQDKYGIIVNGKTGETLYDMHKKGVLPNSVESLFSLIGEYRITSYTQYADRFGIDAFRSMIKNFGMTKTDQLELFEFQARRQFLQEIMRPQ